MSDTKSDVTDSKPEDAAPEAGPEGDKPGTDTEGTQPEGEAGKESEKSGEDDEDEGDETLPEKVRDKIKKANREAEGLRKRLKDLEDKLTGAKTPEEVAAVTTELTQTNEALTLDLARERALRKHGLEEDDLVLLTASSPEDIDKQAERIASRIGGGGTGSLKGGLDPTDEDDEPTDPGELAKKYGRKRY